jgi:lipopolysaccharide/colanic/teichoic acid biosynthesis glycosyltransferase
MGKGQYYIFFFAVKNKQPCPISSKGSEIMTWLAVDRPLEKLYRLFYRTIKRILEITFCLLLLPVLTLLILVIAVAIHLDSPGPVFLVQRRIGKGGRYFNIFKFRTRCYGFDQQAQQAFMEAFIDGNKNSKVESLNNNYITPVGHFLISTGLDELPQLFNVLKGEMSFIGPRPIVPRELEAYQKWHEDRLAVLPGITGLAQIRGHSGLLVDEITQHDIEYIEKQGFWLDLRILWRAVTAVPSIAKK